MLRLIFWPLRELGKFFTILWLLVTFTTVGNFVDGRGLMLHLIEKSVHAWNQARMYAAEAGAKAGSLETIRVSPISAAALGTIDTGTPPSTAQADKEEVPE